MCLTHSCSVFVATRSAGPLVVGITISAIAVGAAFSAGALAFTTLLLPLIVLSGVGGLMSIGVMAALGAAIAIPKMIFSVMSLVSGGWGVGSRAARASPGSLLLFGAALVPQYAHVKAASVAAHRLHLELGAVSCSSRQRPVLLTCWCFCSHAWPPFCLFVRLSACVYSLLAGVCGWQLVALQSPRHCGPLAKAPRHTKLQPLVFS